MTLKRTLAIAGILFVLLGTYLIYVSSETKGRAGVFGPTAGTPEEAEYHARLRRNARIGAVGYALIVIGSAMSVPLVLSSP